MRKLVPESGAGAPPHSGHVRTPCFITEAGLVALADLGLSEIKIAAYLKISVDSLSRLRREFALEAHPFEQQERNLLQAEIQLQELADALTAAAAWIHINLIHEHCGSTAFRVLSNAAAQIDRAHQEFRNLRNLVPIGKSNT